MNELLKQEKHFVSWASWVAELLATAEKDFEGFELGPKEVDEMLDRAVWIDGNSWVN